MEAKIDELLTINLSRVEATVLYFTHIKIICKVICFFFATVGEKMEKRRGKKKKAK